MKFFSITSSVLTLTDGFLRSKVSVKSIGPDTLGGNANTLSGNLNRHSAHGESLLHGASLLGNVKQAKQAAVCSGNGYGLNGICICNDTHYGHDCSKLRCKNDCGGNGKCRGDGSCQCHIGYTGEFCSESSGRSATNPLPLVNPPQEQAIAESIDAAAVVGAAKASEQKKCLNDCYGNGECDDGFCKCFEGYTNDDCSAFCPNGCSAQGTCVDGACLCFGGFTGADCSLSTACSGNGNDGNPQGICVCNPGFAGAQCEVALECPDPTCSNHGRCDLGTCHCEGGFSGAICEVPPKECAPCEQEGATCDRLTGKCMCGGSPCPEKKKEMTAEEKQEQWEEDEASKGFGDIDQSRLSDENCSGHGVWNYGIQACDCEPQWHGEKCEIQHCPGFNETLGIDDCHDQGMCIRGVCHCLKGFGYDPANDPPPPPPPGGSSGSDAAEPEDAVVPAQDAPAPDAALFQLPNGQSRNNSTAVLTKVAMMQGTTKLSSKVQKHTFRKAYSHADASQSCRDRICELDCGKHGECTDGTCVCEKGWKGPYCREPACGLDSTCSGRGVCTFQAADTPGICVCNDGFSGESCENEAFANRKCPNDCSGQGVCLDGKCVCGEGFVGEDCAKRNCAAGMAGPQCDQKKCPKDCSSHGLCFNGECGCWKEYMGSDCSIPKVCGGPCHDACAGPKLGTEKCEFCKGQCLTLSRNPVIGRHNPFSDMLTLLGLKGTVVQHDRRDNETADHVDNQVVVSDKQQQLRLMMKQDEERVEPKAMIQTDNDSDVTDDDSDVLVENLGTEEYNPAEYE